MFFGRKRYKNSFLPLKSCILLGKLLAFQLDSSLLCRKAEQMIGIPGPYLVNASSIYSSWLLPWGNWGRVAQSFFQRILIAYFLNVKFPDFYNILWAKSSTGAPDCFSSLGFQPVYFRNLYLGISNCNCRGWCWNSLIRSLVITLISSVFETLENWDTSIYFFPLKVIWR